MRRHQKTLAFCTSYADTFTDWNDRYRLWLISLNASGVAFDHVLIVDDGSPILPGWPDTRITYDLPPGGGLLGPNSAGVTLHHFRERLGRSDDGRFPGWYRSFGYAAAYAERHGYQKVIYLESDAHVIGGRLVAFINNLTAGWSTVWCPRHDFPEMAVQIIAGKSVKAWGRFCSEPYGHLEGRTHETALPFTQIDRSFIGDRYGEYADLIPMDADFAAQTLTDRESKYYWWLQNAAWRGFPRLAFSAVFGKGGSAAPIMETGWSFPEDGAAWMEGTESVVTLPPLEAAGGGIITLHCQPFIAAPRLPEQRLGVEINGVNCGQFVMASKGRLKMPFPRNLVSPGSPNRVRLLHENATSPHACGVGEDRRRLSFYVFKLLVHSLDDSAVAR